jgi:hypothetical protein
MKNEIVIPILNEEYKVIFCWGEPADVQKVMKKWHYPEDRVKASEFSGRGVCFYAEDCHPIIAMPKKPEFPVEIGTLAHESVHAVLNILQKIGETGGCEEIIAHSVGAIVRKVMGTKP